MSWSVLVEGELRREVESVLRGFASGRHTFVGPTLASGTAGAALLWGSLALELGDETAQARCEEALAHTFDALSAAPSDFSLYQGLSGTGWVLLHLHQRGLLEPQDESLEQIEPLLMEHSKRSSLYYDLIFGYVGLGVYGLERLPSPWAREFLSMLVGHFARLAIETEQGATWHSHPETIGEFRDLFPEGTYNVGLAHGVPGVVSLLARCAAAGIRPEESERWARAGIRWLLAQRMGDRFPSRWYHNRPPDKARDAWCYGNPGVGIALLSAAHALGDAQLEREAISILLDTATPGRETGVVDASLCHGSAGLVHIFNRAYQATGDTRLKEAAIDWLRRTLRLVKRDGDEVFFDAVTFPRDEKGHRKREIVRDDGILTGGAGVALALLSTISPSEPTWDRFLMTDVPAAHRALAGGA
ncbi:lanthionine synthetase C family protein [Archangium lansingense]|uniref:Lanthionine synthetase C family protein n=1 Tax=Archangium lansingense TaxID=2995310 RepID=A0ABT4A968_9BACT|nr:lanthionine synthetase C family protein [Archangium lansinium]MCY1077794.1 lanthionine synthetase C family protein [Archangium lansinium]